MTTLTFALTRLAARPARLCRRLHTRIAIAHRRWLLKDLRAQLDRLEAAMAEATDYVVDLARMNQRAPALQARRRGMRARHELLAERWLAVRRELDNLERTL